MEPDHDVTHPDQDLGHRVVLANPVGRIMRWAIDVDGRSRVPIEEIGLGGVSGDPVLRVARQPKSQLLHVIEPAVFEPAVATSAQCSQTLGSGSGTAGRADLGR